MSNKGQTPTALDVPAGSDQYDARLREWCEKHGVVNSDYSPPMELFIEPDSEMDETIDQETQDDGIHVDLFDCSGWRERYKIADLRAHVAKHGKLSTWDDFAKLGDLQSEDVFD